MSGTAYFRARDYRFALSKGVSKSVNLLTDKPNVRLSAKGERSAAGRTGDKFAKVKPSQDYRIPEYSRGAVCGGMDQWENDNMAGRGTTLRTAADLGRRAIGIEINPAYCDLVRRRMAQAVRPLVN